MGFEYAAIKADNERRYGTDIGRIGPILLADRYDERTHFIFELLQNAEDALARREDWQGSRTVHFVLDDAALHISHFGQPFSEADVRGVCGIAESTKRVTEIGRFGIGFKSVYTFTDRPEIYSGHEAFAIESLVSPVAVPPIDRPADATVIVLPLKGGSVDRNYITQGLQNVNARSLLFLRQIEQIDWRVADGPTGFYIRSKPEVLAPGVRRVTVIGQQAGMSEVDEHWLIFDRQVTSDDGTVVGCVEIAFSLVPDGASDHGRIQPVAETPLVVFFPTIFKTNLGFLVQGPYRTTPSRDNVTRQDPWNNRLVADTASLLVDVLAWLRDNDLLDVEALSCLPLKRETFAKDIMFAPLFEAVRDTLRTEALLPSHLGGYVSAQLAKLSRGQELRDLFAHEELDALFKQPGTTWLSGDITQDRVPELRSYLMQELDVGEITPVDIISKLDVPFLQAQPDSWLLKLYHFLGGQIALNRRLVDRPLIRLEDGTHVPPFLNDKPQAFLPGATPTGFPTVRHAVCATKTARKFLETLGLTEPDPVDDVVYNILPTYREDAITVHDDRYNADIQRILTAFDTDSKAKRQKLTNELHQTRFVRVVDADDGTKRFAKADETYLPTQRLTDLFKGIKGISFVDNTYECLRGEPIRDLLEACGAARTLKSIAVQCDLSPEQLTTIRRNNGLERATRGISISDTTVRGLDGLLKLLPQLAPVERRQRTALLWDALADLKTRLGDSVFQSTYTWEYAQTTKTASFDAAFVRKLNASAWVPDATGELQCPYLILFEALAWKPNLLLQSKILFKPPLIEALAREAGFEPGMLDLLKKVGVTSEAELRERLGLNDTRQGDGLPVSMEDAINDPRGDTPPPRPPAPDPLSGGGASGNGVATSGGHSGGSASSGGHGMGVGLFSEHSRGDNDGRAGHTATAAGAGSRPFVSYLAAHPDEEPPDPEGLDHAARMKLESQAIGFIIEYEPQLQPTPTHNPGFDLFEPGANGQPVRWIEVKAMTGSFQDRPATMSHTQFDYARERGDAYWLYVVEHAGTEYAHLVRIQNPAGKVHTFTFDRGWLAVAEMSFAS